MKALTLLVTLATLTWGASTIGTVFDKTTQKPIPNAIIISGSKEYRTDCNGAFKVPSSPIIGARAIGYERKFYKSGGRMYLQPFQPKALYLSSFGATHGKIMGNAKEIIKNTEINALVIDIKMDRGQIAFATTNPIANKIGAQELILFKDIKKFTSDLRKEGIYSIARIVTFKDTPLITAYPQWGVRKSDGSLFKDKEGLYWIDPSQKKSWDYMISIAEETAKAGFDEIQFDYVRFPDAKGVKFSVENTQAERVKAISGFLEAARTRLTPYNVFISADIFGYVSWHNADIEIGQRVDALSPYVDYLSPMLYPSGFNAGIPGHPDPVKANYEVVKQSLDKALEKSGTSPLAYRPWLQAFRDYAFDRRIYGAKEIREQIAASEAFGSCGWILWNPRNVYSSQGLK
ncbi:MAG: putative glycoside hydrolase [Sulfuricurvum sp.]|uniref:putative glycoside hydrolase n=1 Tax=Sulfuricurvum sp. TaxID=2025608 RepID=UPI002732FEAF|nr:putative glycoside hydrolase [Sulfuricurvum sp.]MDP2851350.1 putative glycoside hydrolase [Sulfuricurvum sp.]